MAKFWHGNSQAASLLTKAKTRQVAYNADCNSDYSQNSTWLDSLDKVERVVS